MTTSTRGTDTLSRFVMTPVIERTDLCRRKVTVIFKHTYRSRVLGQDSSSATSHCCEF